MKVNFHLKAPQEKTKLPDGTEILIKDKDKKNTPIVVNISKNDERLKIHTDRTIHPRHWNKTDKVAHIRKSFRHSTEWNNWLADIRAKVGEIENDWKQKHRNEKRIPVIELTYVAQELKQYLSKESIEEREERRQNTFWGYYDRILERMNTGVRAHSKNGTPLAKGTIYQFRNLHRHLKNFENSKKGLKLDFENIDLKFYNDFLSYLIKIDQKPINNSKSTDTKNKKASELPGLSPNTIGKLITNLKVFMREAYEEGLTKNTSFSHRKFKSISVQSDTIYLTTQEIKEMQALNLTAQPRFDRVRDLFIVGCYTGLRYSDLIRISPEKINDGMIELAQAKTGGTVFIPIVKDVLEILEKYNYKMPRISNQKYNSYLKQIAQKCELLQTEVTTTGIKGGEKFIETLPKYNLVSSHTARRSFATNEYKAKDLTVSEIMSITGHKTEKAFYRYIRETPKETAERIKDKFKQRDLRQAAGRSIMKAV